MKSKWLVVFFAALLPMAAAAQIAPEKPQRAENPDDALRWKIYAGAGYTSLNQVNRSRHGLIGVDLAVSRNFGRYFAATADGAFYSKSLGSQESAPAVVNNASVDLVLAGAEVHGPITERFNLFGRALIGGAHTGGTDQRPDISFAGGLGGGLEYVLTHRILLRVSGDDIASAFSLTGATSQNGYSAHTRWNPRASVGVAYRF